MDPNKRYQDCSIPSCQCGKSGLVYRGQIGDTPRPIPSDLSFLKPGGCDKWQKGQPKIDGCEFDELIDFWNANIPCNKSVCSSMYTPKTTVPPAVTEPESDYGSSSYSDYNNVCETKPECNSECPEYDEYDESCESGNLKGRTTQKIQQRVINGARYPAGATPWLVALDWKPKNDIELANKYVTTIINYY